MSATRDPSATGPTPLGSELDALRDAIYRRNPQADEATLRLRERVAVFSRRVDLLAAIAAADADPSTASERLRGAAEAVRAEPPDDASAVLDVALAQLVAGQSGEAAVILLQAADAEAMPPVSDVELGTFVDRLVRGGRYGETRELLRELLVALAGRQLEVHGLTDAELDFHRGNAATALPPTRRVLLRAAVAGTERYLARWPDDDALPVLLAAGQVMLGRSAEALETADAVLSRRSDSEAQLVRVMALARLGRYREAVEAVQALVSSEPNPAAELEAWKSKLLSADDRPEEALQIALESLRRGGEDPDLELAEAEGLAKAGEVDQGLAVLDEMLARDPGAPRPLLARAGILQRDGRSTEALETTHRLLVVAPEEVEAHMLLAQLLFERDEADEGLSAIDRAVALAPDDPEPTLVRARHRLDQGLTFLALEDIDRAQHLGASGPKALALRARVLAEIGRTEDALTWTVRAFKSSTGADRLELVGEVEALSYELLASETSSAALPALDELSRSEALTAFGHTLRAEALRLAGRSDDAIEEADVAMAGGGDASLLRGTRAAALVESGSSEDGLTEILEVLDKNPDYPFGLSVQITALDALGRVTDALAVLNERLKPPPAGWEDWTTMARAQILNDLGRFTETVELLEPALADKPNAWDWQGTLGVAENRLGRPQQAATRLERAIEGVGSVANPWPLVELADALAARAGRCDDHAAVQYRRVVEVAEGRPVPKSVAAAGWAHFRTGSTEEAVKAYRDAFAKSGDPMVAERLRYAAMLAVAFPEQLATHLDSVAERLEALPDPTHARALIDEGHYLVALLEAAEWRDQQTGCQAMTKRLTEFADQREAPDARGR